jgi:ABC-2 type transport system ATP-binding protein
MNALELVAVSKRYPGRTALAGVSFAVPVGATVGLLGPNGAGKTTTLRLLLGFARPSGGAIRLQGRDPGDPEARAGLGYLPERLALPARASVRSILSLHGRLIGLSGLGLRRAVDDAIERTGIADRAADAAGGLSKGLAQRVGFAAALLGEPKLLLLDEPTSGLDPIGVRDARDWIVDVRARGATVLVSSHVLSEIERICDHVVVLDGGSIVASGLLTDVLEAGESLEDAFVRLVRS